MAEHRSFRLTHQPIERSVDQTAQPDTATHGRAITVGVAQQGLMLILASLTLDGGFFLFVCTVAAIASWGFTLIVIVRRPIRPTNMDLAVIKHGFWPALLVTLLLRFVGVAATSDGIPAAIVLGYLVFATVYGAVVAGLVMVAQRVARRRNARIAPTDPAPVEQ